MLCESWVIWVPCAAFLPVHLVASCAPPVAGGFGPCVVCFVSVLLASVVGLAFLVRVCLWGFRLSFALWCLRLSNMVSLWHNTTVHARLQLQQGEQPVVIQSERIMQQQVEITEAQDKLHSLEQNNSKLQGEVDSLKQMIDAKKAGAERECQRRERLEKEARELKSAIGARTSQIKQKSLQLKSAEEQQVCPDFATRGCRLKPTAPGCSGTMQQYVWCGFTC